MLKVALVLLLILPDGKYKDFVSYFETAQECETGRLVVEKEVANEIPKGTAYALDCIPVRNVGDVKL